MPFFNTNFQQIKKLDLINAFEYGQLQKLPKLQTIILNFSYKKSNFKRLISGLLAFEFITSKKGELTKSKCLNITLKIKQGQPVGCKVVLKKKAMYRFHSALLTSVFPKLKNPQNAPFKPNWKALSISIQNPLIFMELENHYEIFKDIPKLDITILTNAKSENEFFFVLESIKIFL
jgi:large subunit ribosomal protein L5